MEIDGFRVAKGKRACSLVPSLAPGPFPSTPSLARTTPGHPGRSLQLRRVL